MNQQFILVGIISILSWTVYKYYQQSEQHFDEALHYKYAAEYFVGDDRMHPRRPFLWVHYSEKETPPYLVLTMKSILDKCKESFNVCLINDDVFRRLIPNWQVKMDALPSPLKEHYRQFALTTLLYYYGGMTVPASTLCIDDLHGLYKNALAEKTAFAVETVNRSAVSAVFLPDPLFMGCTKRSELMKGLMQHEGALLKTDHTEQADFLGSVALWCAAKVAVVDGRSVGVKKPCGAALDLSELLGNNAFDLHPDASAICLPADEILKRPKYGWFARISQQELMQGELAVAKYF